MGQETDEIKRHIESKREDLGNNIQELQARVKEAADWRTQVDRHPWVALGAAFAGGLLLSRIGRG